MKTIKCLLIALVALFGIHANAQTVDEIIDKNVSAMGGKEKLATLKTVKMNGTMNAQGNDISLTLTKSHLAGARLDLELMGTSNYQMANVEKGWKFMPVMGMTEPKEMDADEFKSFSTQMDIQGPLFNYKEKNNKVEFVGSEEVNGSQAHKLQVTYPNGKTSMFFIDAKSNRLIKTSGKTMVQGQETDVETSLSDYKQNGDGYWFPYSITNKQGTISFDKIETNVKVEETLFKN